jgi:tRNA1(Val) A37 N6-methylase TrmN6
MASLLLDKAIKELGFENGDLYDASDNPQNLSGDDWLNKSDWLKSANKAGADKVLFIEDNPVVVFAHCADNEIKNKFNRIWCLSRPRLLFLESLGELSVIDLAQAPIDPDSDKRTLKYLEKTSDFLEKLQKYSYENIESGKVFSDERFGDLSKRADYALINDLKEVKAELLYNGLSYSSVHKLIARSIFIRYLEDREILTEEYYKKVAENNKSWQRILNSNSSEELFDFSDKHSLYSRVLQSKSFTYALFDKLMQDFNGDMFPDIDIEKKEINDNHLEILKDLLYGNTGIQKKLFFYSYKFNIIPLSLISSICEEFYHTEPIPQRSKKARAKQSGAFYTPPVLAEFVLSKALTADVLINKPRVLDPACGSGIFLVEAFRRIIRFNIRNGNDPTFDDLKRILKKQIAGIEINEDAARITAFSLNLALLNYLEPPSIIEQIKKKNRLPNLIDFGNNIDEQNFNIIQTGNAFNFSKAKLGEFDIIVGNPPWGEVSGKNQEIMLNWCAERNYPIADKESSQAFLYFASDLLKNAGNCVMLVSSGVLLNFYAQKFRKCLFSRICINEVYNFIHIRRFFFKEAISPFLLIHFTKKNQDNNAVNYWLAKRSNMSAKAQTIIFSKYDRALLINQDLIDNKTWKINWFGRYADVRFISSLCHLKKFYSFIDRKRSGQGFKHGAGEKKCPEIAKLPFLDTDNFTRYTKLKYSISPKSVYFPGKFDIYHGSRLLIKRGIRQTGEERHIISCRFEKKDFCFRSSIDGIKLIDESEDNYLLFLGILLSSFTKYYLFNTTAGWGCWHDDIHYDFELLQLPIPEDIFGSKAGKVISIVKELRNTQNISNHECKGLEKKLDKAVFDMYEFTEQQCILITDFCNVTIPFFYDPYSSLGTKPVIEKGNTKWITDYAKSFAEFWQMYLNNDEVLRADLCIDLLENLIAIEFYIADINDDWDLSPKDKVWQSMLSQISKNLTTQAWTSRVFLEGIVQIITDKSIIIIKRNEKRFWTRSLANEDAESVMTKRILNSNTKTGSSK